MEENKSQIEDVSTYQDISLSQIEQNVENFANKGLFILVSGVSGAGKATMVSLLKKNNPYITDILSWKTRLLRPGEVDGVDYHYITTEEFKNAIAHNEFLEYALVHKTSYYGTKKKDIEDALEKGGVIVKEVDMQGLESIAQVAPELFANSCRIFLDVSDEIMRERIESRAPTTEEEIQYRLDSAIKERKLAIKYSSYIISAELSIPQVYESVKNAIQKFCDEHGIAIVLQ